MNAIDYLMANTANNVHSSPALINTGNNKKHIIRRGKNDYGIAIERETTIKDFYAGQSVFITGSTGFFGKMLIEKLLRSCPDISTIFLLIRAKRGKSVEDRLEDIFNDPLYDRLREEVPKFRHKVIAVSGDCASPGLGLSSAERERLINEVSIIFHSAATVRFDEKLDISLASNVGSIFDMIELCKRMKRFKAFIHVSTVYAHCCVSKIKESFYPHSTTYEDLNALLSGLDDREIAAMTPKILGQWPNTYTFTKALAETVLKENSQGLSVGIFRPGMIVSTAYEPIPGWMSNFYGPTGVMTAAASGLLKTMHCDPMTLANIVPGDLTINALIASAWDVANHPERRDDKMLIYNYVSTVEAPTTWQAFLDNNVIYGNEFPLSKMKRTMSLTLQKHKTLDFLSRIFVHYLPAILVDLFSVCLGKKPKLMETYKKTHKFLNAITWFCTRDWIFTNDNVQNLWNRLGTQDRQEFHFSMKKFEWSIYSKNYMKGIRIYLLKDDISTLEASRKKWKRLHMIEIIFKALSFTVLLHFLWKIAELIFFRVGYNEKCLQNDEFLPNVSKKMSQVMKNFSVNNKIYK